MVLHEEPYTKADLWWIMYKVFYHVAPKGNYKREWYYNIACAFDIETTSIMIDDEKSAYMYIYVYYVSYSFP